MNKHWVLAFGALGAVIGVVLAASADLWKTEELHVSGVHYHTGFQIYIDNQLQDFSDMKYMKMDPCGDAHAITDDPEEEQLEKAHLHDFNDDVAHMHRNGATWGDLFMNMDYDFPEDMPRQVYVNGQRFEGEILDEVINANDSVIFFLGSNDDIPDKLAAAVTLERIQEVEQLSENCAAAE